MRLLSVFVVHSVSAGLSSTAHMREHSRSSSRKRRRCPCRLRAPPICQRKQPRLRRARVHRFCSFGQLRWHRRAACTPCPFREVKVRNVRLILFYFLPRVGAVGDNEVIDGGAKSYRQRVARYLRQSYGGLLMNQKRCERRRWVDIS